MGIEFDPSQKLILITPPDTIVRAQDIYDAAMDWIDDPHNMQYDPPMRSTGKAPLGGGVYTDAIYVLINGWKIQFWSTTSHSFTDIPESASYLTAESTSGNDTTQTIEVHGYDPNGNVVKSNKIQLQGTTPVVISNDDGPIDFTVKGFCPGIFYVHLSAATEGSVIIKTDEGDTVVILAPGDLEARANYTAEIIGTLITEDGSPRTKPPTSGYIETIFRVSSQATIIDQEFVKRKLGDLETLILIK